MNEADVHREICWLWQQLAVTLHQRGLLRERPRQGGVAIPVADAYLLPDRAVFVLDMQRLAGIPREAWLQPDLWAQWRAALQGRRVFVCDGGGLAICVAREPGVRSGRLPAVIPLTREHLPDQPYHVFLGFARRGPLYLDIAGEHRAILVGGASGGGKTNLLQGILLQLASRHPPDEVRFAVVDTKLVDFSAYSGLPHLFVPSASPEACPIAHDLAEAAVLIEQVEADRLRRQALLARVGVSDWRQYNGCPVVEPLPLLLLLVDEAADLAGTPAMRTLIAVARKGRAFGISVIVCTQHPSARVIDAQVRANLPTAIAFQTRTDVESRVILGRGGAEALGRPGLALTFIGGRWEEVQTPRVDTTTVQDFLASCVRIERPMLSEVQAALVRTAVEELGGAFIVGRLYELHGDAISKRALTALAQQWEARGWLTHPADAVSPRYVTAELLALVPSALDANHGDRVIGMTGDDRDGVMATGVVTGDLRGATA